ncbi:carboxypeptidase-like regulatory domain-containing protein [Granulicella tundricola]|uniref:Carboxypeptidase regulatory-like domain-containing protein n=1 Tax=Granulicella tundricola (strain ATCC BAA-1859 / DSM 23138 / MP5ACTX9) TaxID=1198114 RepID=E8X0G5_GRATM|nr:carboxypeptidase-like regulatory domain-containing protein [Granulicella tundricola]ADW67829.1 hypothetical protein AciX9_0760 [Granulicella tundricola MP5ACTX9]
MSSKQALSILLLSLSAPFGIAQQVSGPQPQSAGIVGTATDTDGGLIPGATVTIDGPTPEDHHTAIADASGVFTFTDLHPAVAYHLMVTAKGFAAWNSPEEILTPGEERDLKNIPLAVGVVETSVSAITIEQLATEQVKIDEKQRVFGVIPNFYVEYDHQFAPLSTKLKYQLAFKASTDAFTFAAAAFLAGIDQAADTPAYVEGAKGYGQRFGAVYAQGASGILIGGAILPSLLHQDPRYFYQGTGTKKSRALHAASAPFIARGDNGRWQFNYSSIGGDLASSALTNIYYPPTNRGAGLVFGNAAVATGGRVANALLQEFVLHKVTHGPKRSF